MVSLGVDADDAALNRFNVGMGAAVKLMALAAAGAVAVTAALTAMTLATVKQGDEAAKAGARVGVTAQEMQELGFAAEQAGASMVDVETAFRRQARAAVDASQGLGRSGDAYKKLGINVRDATGQIKQPLPLFLESAEALSKLTNESVKASIAQEFFGRGASKILPLINAGAAGINALRQEARDLGFVLSAEDAVAAEELTDNMNRLTKIAVGLRNVVGTGLIPVMNTMSDVLIKWFKANRDIIQQRIERVIETIVRGVEFMLDAWRRVDKFVVEEIGGWGEIFDAIALAIAAIAVSAGVIAFIAVLASMGSIIAAIGTAVGVLTSPFVLAFAAITAAVTGALLLLEDFKVFMEGGDSLIGRFLESFGRADEVRDKLNSLFTAVTEFATAIGSVLGPKLASFFNDVLLPAFDRIEAVLSVIRNVLGEIAIAGFEAFLTGLIDGFALLTLGLTDFDAAVSAVFTSLENKATELFGSLRAEAEKFGLGGLLDFALGVAGTTGPVSQFNKAQAAFGGASVSSEQQAIADRALFGESSSSTTSNTFNMGDTNNITGDPAAIQAMLEQRDRAKLQQAMAASRGGTR